MPASKKLNIKIKWSAQQSADLSAIWYEAKVPQLDWTYVVDMGITEPEKYTCFILFENTPTFQEVRLSGKEFNTKKEAMVCCEKHLHRILLKLKKFFCS